MSSGSDTNPPVWLFPSIMKKLMMTSLLNPPKSTNCADDLDTVLIGTLELSNRNPAKSTTGNNDIPIACRESSQLHFNDTDYQLHILGHDTAPAPADFETNIVEDNSVFYLCGFFAKQFLKKHKCSICPDLLLTQQTEITEFHQIFTAIKGYSKVDTFSNLGVSTNDFFIFVRFVCANFQQLLDRHSTERGICKLICADYMDNLNVKTMFALCSEDALTDMLKFIIRCKLYFGVKCINLKVTKKKLPPKFRKK